MEDGSKFFNILFRFIAKEFLHIFRDPRTLGIILGLPIIMIGVFGFALTTDIGELRLLILAPRNTLFVQQLAHQLDASNDIKVVDVLPPTVSTENLFQRNKIDAILKLENHFEDKMVRGEHPQLELTIDGVDPNVAAAGSIYVSGNIEQYLKEYAAQLGNFTKDPIGVRVTLLYNPELRAPYYFVPGVMGLVLMIICALMTSVSIVREKEYGSMDILLTGPMHSGVIIIAKAIPYFIVSCVNILTILLLSRFVLQVPLAGSLTALIFVSMLFIFVSLLLGLLISTMAKTQLEAVIISGCGLLLPVAILSGMIFPLESMPKFIFWLAEVVPATWFVQAIKKLMIQGSSWAGVAKEIYVLLGMAVGYIILSIVTFKNRPD